MKFGIGFANTGPFAGGDGARQMALAAEGAGFESLWTVEHTVVPQGYESPYPYSADGRMPGPEDSPIPDPLVWLTFLAGVTSTINLGTGILILPQRNPVVLAKETATLDVLSGGRLLLGIGVGWLAEEFEAIGVPFAERGARTDDHVAAMRALWSGEAASYDGRFTSFEECFSRPAPTRGAVPIHVGGHTDASATRAGRLGDGFFPASADPSDLARLIDVARSAAVDAGRDPAALEISTMAVAAGPEAVDTVGRLAEAGVDRVIVPAFFFYGDPEASLSTYGEQVISAATSTGAA
jgi:probable F420-dependent oxidoreductase